MNLSSGPKPTKTGRRESLLNFQFPQKTGPDWNLTGALFQQVQFTVAPKTLLKLNKKLIRKIVANVDLLRKFGYQSSGEGTPMLSAVSTRILKLSTY